MSSVNHSTKPAWLNESQWRLCMAADHAWDHMNGCARLVCQALENFGFDDAHARERLSQWKVARDEYDRAIVAAEEARKTT